MAFWTNNIEKGNNGYYSPYEDRTSLTTLDRLFEGNFHIGMVIALCNRDGLLTSDGSGNIEAPGLLHDLRDGSMPELVGCPKWDLLILRQTFIDSID